MNVLTIDDDAKAALTWAIEFALEDQEHYLQTGDPETDYGNEWADVAGTKAEILNRLGAVCRQLGVDGLAEWCESLAAQYIEAEEEARDGEEVAPAEPSPPFVGQRMRTKVPDSNCVDEGEVQIPVGWLATIGELQDDHYPVRWDDGPNGRNMGWCLWTAEEILRDATLLGKGGSRGSK